VSDPILDEINLTTLREIYPKTVEDNFFLDTPFQAYLRSKALVPFGGGAYMSNTFLYAPLIGGSYAKGASVTLAKVQTLAGSQFDPKYYAVPIIEYKEDIQVLNKGPQKVFSLIDLDLKNGMQTISAIIAIAMQNHGQASGSTVSTSRPNDINGWVEALNDGVTNGYDGNIYSLYGGVTRNGVVGSTWNSVPYFCGDSNGNAGPLTYQILEETYQDCSIGRMEPDLGVTTKAGIAYIKERMQPQQRFAQEKDPVWGVSGFRFNSAMILKDGLLSLAQVRCERCQAWQLPDLYLHLCFIWHCLYFEPAYQ
jgi:hypothetical protein